MWVIGTHSVHVEAARTIALRHILCEARYYWKAVVALSGFSRVIQLPRQNVFVRHVHSAASALNLMQP